MAWEVHHPKMEFGLPSTAGLNSMGRMSIRVGNDVIVEEMAEIHDLLQWILVVPPSLEALRVHLHTINSSVGVGGPLHMLVVPFWRDRFQESGQSTIGTQKSKGRGRIGPNYGQKSWVLAHCLGTSLPENGIRAARYRWLKLDGGNEH